MTTEERIEHLEKQVAKLRWQVFQLAHCENRNSLARFAVAYDLSAGELELILNLFRDYDKVLREMGHFNCPMLEDDLMFLLRNNEESTKRGITGAIIVQAMKEANRWLDVCQHWDDNKDKEQSDAKET